MRTYSQFLEDLEQRKVALAQRRQQQMARIKQQNAQSASDTEERIGAANQQAAENDEEMKRREDERKAKRDAAPKKPPHFGPVSSWKKEAFSFIQSSSSKNAESLGRFLIKKPVCLARNASICF